MKKKWYQNNFIVIALLVLFWPVGLIFMWKYSAWKKNTKTVVTCIVLSLLLIFYFAAKSSPSYEDGRNAGMQSQQRNYEIIDKQANTNVENYKVLVKPGVDGEPVVKDVKTQCSIPCNIEIYDDRKALDLQKDYDNLVGEQAPLQELDSWKKTNYIYVADHFIGYVTFDSDAYQKYPFKDFLYKELKGE